MTDAETHAALARQMFGDAYTAAGPSAFHKNLADGLGQVASALLALAEEQARIARIVASLR